MPIINLLKKKEITEFDSPPIVTEQQRAIIFSDEGMEEMRGFFRKPISRVGYILQRGYFILQKKFYLPNQFHNVDVKFVSLLCGHKKNLEISNYKSQTRINHRYHIMERYGFRAFTKNKGLFIKEVDELVKTALRPRELFFALNEFLISKKTERPKYYVFASAIGSALNTFELNLVSKVDGNLDLSQKNLLDGLMVLPAGKDSNENSPYLITSLKKPIQATTPNKIEESILDFNTIADLHREFYKIVKGSDISSELLNYYAVWVIKAKHVQFDSISSIAKKRLFLIAFITYQYRVRQDLFVDTFLQAIQKFYNDADKRVAESFLDGENIPLTNKGRLSKIKEIILSSTEQMDKVREILFAREYKDSEKLYMLKDLVGYGQEPYQEKLLNELSKLENTGMAQIKENLKYGHLEKGYRRIQNRVGGILQILEFNPRTSDLDLLTAVDYYQKIKGRITSKAPTEFISKAEQKRIYSGNGEFLAPMYKVLLFKEVANHIKAGSLNLLHSEKYKSIDEYLISPDRWQHDRELLLERANLLELADIGKFISDMKAELHRQYERTNENAAKNVHLRFSREGKAIVKTPRIDTVNTEGILSFLGQDGYLPLIKVLSDIRHSTNFSESFIHYSRRSSKKVLGDDIMYAAIIALGCNIGVRKMGKISRGIGSDRLEYAVRWHFSKENIDDANRRIVSFTNKLFLPSIFVKEKGAMHTSSDGQKFDVTVPSLHATRSYKYFGFEKGVSAYSFIDEKSRLFYSTVISASEREAGYVIDGLMHNDEIESNVHSTDTHGYSEIVFGICNALGIFFAPRIKNYKDQLMYSFKEKPRKYYERCDYKVLPSKGLYIDEKNLKAQWENILRLLCSIKLKETKSSKILGRLSSYSKQHPLYKALKELGRIFKSIFILRYLDESPLRQGIEKQLNRIEQSHQFAKAVFFGNNQEFKLETKEEQEIAVGCRHLVQNAIMLWNYLFLSEKLSQIKDIDENKRVLDSVKRSSIMTWQHINLHGEYDFQMAKGQTSFDIDKIMSYNMDK